MSEDIVYVLRGGWENKVLYFKRQLWRVEKRRQQLRKKRRFPALTKEPYQGLLERDGHEAVKKYSIHPGGSPNPMVQDLQEATQ